jgi:hypothetical protein
MWEILKSMVECGLIMLIVLNYLWLKELISYETWYGVKWLGGEDDIAWLWRTRLLAWRANQRLGCDRPCGSEARARTWHRLTGCKCATVKSKRSFYRWTNRPHDDMKWILSSIGDEAKCWFILITSGLTEDECFCGIIDGGDEMECAKKRYICRAFYFTGLS